MIDIFFNDNAADITAMKMPCHTIRIGRELAMLYLFISEMHESALKKYMEQLFEETKSLKQLFEDDKSLKQLFEDDKSLEQLFEETESLEQLFEEAESREQLFDIAKSLKQLFEETESLEQLFEEAKSLKQLFEKAKALGLLFEEAKSHEKVFEEAAGIMHWQASRELRKGQEYAENLLDVWNLHQPEIDDKIRDLSANWEWDRLSSVDRQIMRVAACEMMFVPDVPPVVSINEAVEIANDYSGENSGNFINGVLNAIKNQLSRPAREAVDHL